MCTLKEKVYDEDWSKGNEEVGCDNGDNKEGARDHGNAAQEGTKLLRDFGVDDINVGGESVEDPSDGGRLKEGERGMHCLFSNRIIELFQLVHLKVFVL